MHTPTAFFRLPRATWQLRSPVLKSFSTWQPSNVLSYTLVAFLDFRRTLDNRLALLLCIFLPDNRSTCWVSVGHLTTDWPWVLWCPVLLYRHNLLGQTQVAFFSLSRHTLLDTVPLAGHSTQSQLTHPDTNHTRQCLLSRLVAESSDSRNLQQKHSTLDFSPETG